VLQRPRGGGGGAAGQGRRQARQERLRASLRRVFTCALSVTARLAADAPARARSAATRRCTTRRRRAAWRSCACC
jgi:hypothetical protein